MADVLYLSRDDVRRVLPAPDKQLELVASTYRATANGEVELPPKPGIHPREDSFLHAMPVYLANPDVAAVKWIGGSSFNKTRDLPYLSGLIIVNDPQTAAPLAIMDAIEITTARTAAVSGVCVRAFADSEWQRVTIIGFGEQGRAHGRLLAEMNPAVQLSVCTRTPQTNGVSSNVRFYSDPQEAVRGADVVITAIPFARPPQPFVTDDWLKHVQLVVPIDFDSAVAASAVAIADTFLVDDVDQFEYYRNLGYFAGWRHPDGSLADALGAKSPRASGLSVCCPLGVASVDAVFANYVMRAAIDAGIGTSLQQ